MTFSYMQFIIPPPSRYTTRLISKIIDKTKGLDLWFLVHFSDDDLEDYLIRLYT